LKNGANRKEPAKKPFISIYFDCCRIYQRIYINATGTAFVGWCPRCCRRAEIKISPFGTDDRFFIAR
jgi:hypothetical protein